MKFLPLLTIPFLLCSCETTGDPSQGGLFGWSSSKADQRIEQKHATLNALEGDTNSQQRRSARMQSQLDN